jgi:hypothetical protein
MTGTRTDTAEVVARLARIEGGGILPPSVASRAGRMRAALERPVRVTVFGLPGTGKTAVMNILAGAPVMPGVQGLPTTEVLGGPHPATELTLGDGRRIRRDGLPTEDDLALEPAFLRLTVPGAPGLQLLSLLEVVTDGSAGDLAAAIRWALPRTDIALWCTERLTDADRVAWEAAPDELKDHAVMVLTGAKGPVPAGRPIRSGLPAGFRAAWPVWRDQLDAALATGDPAALAASGARALAQAVADMAHAGRAADIEAALMVLSRFEPPEWRPVPVPETESEAGPGASNMAPQLPAAPIDPAPPGGLRPRPDHPARAVQAILHLQHQAGALLGDIAPDLDVTGSGADAWSTEVLGRCAAIAGDLAAILEPEDLASPDEEERLEPLRAAVDEVADLTVLLQIEGGPSQAADAAALVCQLRRGFDRALAA